MRRKRRDIPPTRAPQRIPPAPDQGGIYHATVGWEEAGALHYDLLESGVAMVKARLFKGHNPVTEGENTNPERAKGHQVVFTFDPKQRAIPEDGTHVLLARPAGTTDYTLLSENKPDPKWIPNRKSGENVIFGPNDSFIRFREDGSIFAFVKDGTGDDAKPIYLKLHAKGCEIVHPHGKLRSDDIGFEMSHSSGATVRGGALGGLVAPLDVVNSFVTLRAAMIRLDSMVNSFGPDTAAPDTLLKSTPILGVLTALQASLSSVQLWASALAVDLTTAAIPTATSTVPLGNLVTAVTASGVAVTAGATNGPTRSMAGS